MGVLVAEKWIDSVVEARRVCESVMALRLAIGKSVLKVVSVYAPHVGRVTEEKEEFYIRIGKVLKDVRRHEWTCWSRSRRVSGGKWWKGIWH